MASSVTPSLSDIVDETYDDPDDAETMTAAQVLAKLEEVTAFPFAWASGKIRNGGMRNIDAECEYG